jgi:hypothetical protein
VRVWPFSLASRITWFGFINGPAISLPASVQRQPGFDFFGQSRWPGRAGQFDGFLGRRAVSLVFFPAR